MTKNTLSIQTIKRKDNFIFFGNTKCGKTTGILHLLGYNLSESIYCKATSLVVDEKIDSAYESFLAAPLIPCTSSINAVKIPEGIFR